MMIYYGQCASSYIPRPDNHMLFLGVDMHDVCVSLSLA